MIVFTKVMVLAASMVLLRIPPPVAAELPVIVSFSRYVDPKLMIPPPP
jgi:hypothetical protein